MNATAFPPGTPLFEHLSSEQIARLAQLGHTMLLRPGEVLFEVGDPANHLYVVMEGQVELTLPFLIDGERHSVVVDSASAGSTIGWSCFVAPHKYTLGARSPGEGALVSFDRNELLVACRKDPGMGFELMHNLMQTISRRLGRLHAMWVREVQRNVRSEES